MDAPATTIDHGTGSYAAAPDWNHVPFDVACARCGRDLRGLTEPKCPDCALEFDWSDAVPIEQLTCEVCGYHLYGLSEPRCPECGTKFEWDAVLAAYHRRKQMLFEYHWRTRPERSLLASWRRALRPGRLWTQLDIHDPPAVRPLIGQVVIVSVLAWAMCVVLEATWMWLWRPAWRRAAPQPTFAERVMVALRDQEITLMIPLIVGWAAVSLLSLLILRQSMRRYRVRNAHVLRVCAYALPPLVLPAVFVAYAYNMALLAGGGGRRFAHSAMYLCAAALLGFATWSISRAYRNYLKIPHGIGIALSSQIIAVFTLAILSDMATNGRFVGRHLWRAFRWMMSVMNWFPSLFSWG